MKSLEKLPLLLALLLGGAPPPRRETARPAPIDPEELVRQTARLAGEDPGEAARRARLALEEDPLLPGRLLAFLRDRPGPVLFLLGKALEKLRREGRSGKDLVTALLVQAALLPGRARKIADLLAEKATLLPCQADLVIHLFRAPPEDPRRRAGEILLEALLDQTLRRGDPVLAFLFLEDRDPLVRSLGAARLCRMEGGRFASLAPLVAARERSRQVLEALALGLALSPLSLEKKARLLRDLTRAAPVFLSLRLAWRILGRK